MATIHDIATLAGCSARTVSRVFNDSGPVKPSTRDKVLHIAQEMNFRPNMRARGLRTGRTHTIGVIQSSADSEVNRARIDTMTRLFSSADYSLLLNRARNFEHELELLEKMQPSCDAMVIFSSIHDKSANIYDELQAKGYPFMLVDSPAETTYASVFVQRETGYRDAVLELSNRGCRRIGLLLQEFRQEPRLKGYREGLEIAGLPVDNDLIFHCEPSFEGGKIMGATLGKKSSDFDALLCHNDRIAIGVLHSFSKMGVAVPSQVAVVGFDNDRYSAYTTPSLSTVEQGTESIGLYVYEQIYSFLEKGITLQSHTFSTSLIVRDSV